MWYLKVAGTEILKKYLDPSQAYPKDKDTLVKVFLWPDGKSKKECVFKPGKKKVKDDHGNDVDVDGDVELKAK